MATTFQITTIICVFVLGLFASIIPIFFAKRIKFLSYMNIFAAGVFLSIGLMTILPEAAENLEEVSEKFHEFPLAYFLVIVGFFVIFLCEEIAHFYYRKAFGRSSHDVENPDPANITPNSVAYSSADTPVLANDAQDKLNDEVADKRTETDKSLLAAVVLLVALSIHEFLEGFAVGALENPSWGLFVAIMFHKFVESFALGTAFVRAEINRNFFFLIIFIYSLTLPLGIGLGIVTSAEGGVATGTVLALSAGSFLFIATAEIIPEEFGYKHQSDRALRYLALIFGTLVMSLMILVEEMAEEASEEGEDEEEEESKFGLES